MPNNRDLHPDMQRWMAEQKRTFEQATRDIPRVESMADIRAERDAPIRVQIVGKHPHAGEYGTIAVVDGKVAKEDLSGRGVADMLLVRLDDCPHGERGCYAQQKHLRLVKDRR